MDGQSGWLSGQLPNINRAIVGQFSTFAPVMIGNVLLALGLPIIPLINKNLSYKQKSQNFDLSDLLKPLWTMHVHVTNLAFFRQINTQCGVFIYNWDYLFIEVL